MDQSPYRFKDIEEKALLSVEEWARGILQHTNGRAILFALGGSIYPPTERLPPATKRFSVGSQVTLKNEEYGKVTHDHPFAFAVLGSTGETIIVPNNEGRCFVALEQDEEKAKE